MDSSKTISKELEKSGPIVLSVLSLSPQLPMTSPKELEEQKKEEGAVAEEEGVSETNDGKLSETESDTNAGDNTDVDTDIDVEIEI
ncbi:hypothetical protein CHS0354_013679 [Potamilus streckersoni]|uniref:Uncharacterized protein n=1 Tax=Potamilus streckersoni TaxID=2493646 RepID=A0AAE0SEU5_9BIVA|nr:hypothetical protein CHS0354_013679 [Potamilus streckersoni]